jgi:hypothetical protein
MITSLIQMELRLAKKTASAQNNPQHPHQSLSSMVLGSEGGACQEVCNASDRQAACLHFFLVPEMPPNEKRHRT